MGDAGGREVGTRRVQLRLPGRGLEGFRRLVWWCGVPCVALPVLLAAVGLPTVWLIRTEGLLLTVVAAIVTWWACAELTHGSAGQEAVVPDGPSVIAD